MAVVQSVLGAIEPSLLGRTLTHEHLALDFQAFYCSPPEEFKSYLERQLAMETLGFVRQYPYSSRDNLIFDDAAALAATKRDVQLYKDFGGGTIVENSSHGIRSSLAFAVDVARSTGVHIVAGTGHYVHQTQAPHSVHMSVEQMADLYSREMTAGVEVDGIGAVRCGFIGEVGSTFPIHDFEKCAIRATAEIQEALGCGVSFHPGRDRHAPFEIMRLYLEAGGHADKCIMSHLDRTLPDLDELLEFAAIGCYLQFDLFGCECSYYQLHPSTVMPSDGQRIDKVMRLIDEGLVTRLLMSHDVHTKHRLTSYGGHGFHHIHMNVLPQMIAKGVTQQHIDQMTVTNPANWLQFKI